MTETKKSILVVDDEEIIRDFLSEVLEDYSVSLATDGDEAIEKIRSQNFDLIITDLRMPRVSGEEVVRFTRDTYPGSKVIVISGYSSLATVSQTVQNGACAFLAKPFSIKELLQSVEQALRDSGGK